jgi:hypothetical protein
MAKDDRLPSADNLPFRRSRQACEGLEPAPSIEWLDLGMAWPGKPHMSWISYLVVSLLPMGQLAAGACPESPGLAQTSLRPCALTTKRVPGGDAFAADRLEAVMSEDHVEAILLWSANGPSPAAERWLTDRGLAVTPMRAGLLILGDREVFEAVFGVPLASRDLPLSLPVPAALGDNVAAISIRRPPGYQ